MSYTPYDALKWVVREMEDHTFEVKQIVSNATSTPKPAEYLNQIILKIADLADWLDKVSILCSGVVQNNPPKHPDDNITEEELEASRELELERIPTLETEKALKSYVTNGGCSTTVINLVGSTSI